MLKSNPKADAACTLTTQTELHLCANPQCRHPCSGAELTCSFQCAVAYCGFTTAAGECAGAEREYDHILRETGGILCAVPCPDGTWLCPSATRPGVVYHITPTLDGWHCECAGWAFRRHCWHIESVTQQTTTGWAGAWVTANLDLRCPPDGITATPKLMLLSIPELRDVWGYMEKCGPPAWATFCWDTLADNLERELALEW